MNVQQVVNMAYLKLGIRSDAVAPEMAESGLMNLNAIIDIWNANRDMLLDNETAIFTETRRRVRR